MKYIRLSISLLSIIIFPYYVSAYYTNQAATLILGQNDFSSKTANKGGSASDDSFNNPYDVQTDGTRLFVADYLNNRVLIYNSIPISSNTPANVVVGQPDFSSVSINQGGSVAGNTLYEPHGIFVYNGKLFIADTRNNRILIYNSIPTSNNASADIVIGQTSLTTNTSGCSEIKMNRPVDVFISSGTLFIADLNNRRVLMYNIIPSTHNAAADIVIGQQNFTSNLNNQGNATPAANTMTPPSDVYSDGNSLFISDSENNRVLVFNTFPSTHNANADFVIGQTSFFNYSIDQGGSPEANTLDHPAGLYCNDNSLYLADYGNNRIFMYYTNPSTFNASANVVLGQQNFASQSVNQGLNYSTPNTLNKAFNMCIAGSNNMLFIADMSNHRVLGYRDLFNITSATQTSKQNNSTTSLTIYGDDFKQGSTVSLSKSGYTDIVCSDISIYLSSITCSASLLAVPTGFWTILVSSNDYTSTLSNIVEVQSFEISDVSFSAFNTTLSPTTIILTGRYFIDNSAVKLVKSGENDIFATDVVVSSSAITCTFNIYGQPEGLWDIVISSSDFSFVYSDAFNIKSFIPSNTIPEFGYKWTNTRVYIRGSYFVTGSTIALSRAGQESIMGTNVVVSSTVIASSFNLWDRQLGLWDIVITTGSISKTLSSCFLITELSPGYNVTPHASGVVDNTGGSIEVDSPYSLIRNLKLLFPPGSVALNIVINVTINVSINPPKGNSNMAILGEIIDLWPSNMEFEQPVTLALPYTDELLSSFGVSDPYLIDVYTYDTDQSQWVKIDKLGVDPVNKLVSTNITHFSLYTLAIDAIANTDNSIIYPNPFRPHIDPVLTFSVPVGSSIKIFNINGMKICELSDTANSGKLFWNGCNSSNDKVSSGTYIAVINSEGNQTKRLFSLIK